MLKEYICINEEVVIHEIDSSENSYLSTLQDLHMNNRGIHWQESLPHFAPSTKRNEPEKCPQVYNASTPGTIFG